MEGSYAWEQPGSPGSSVGTWKAASEKGADGEHSCLTPAVCSLADRTHDSVTAVPVSVRGIKGALETL